MPATRVTSYETTDWTDLSTAPNTVTANGNRSYSLVFNSTDYTGLIQPGTRVRTTRTVAAPTQCTSLNGTNQYFNKTSPAGMTFTDDFVVSAWVKLNSYSATRQVIASRFNGTSGWSLQVSATDNTIALVGFNGGSANFSQVLTYQSLPLNKWVHIAAQLDMSAFTATTTTSYVMIDGVNVPVLVTRGGTNPTALVQAGNLEIGSRNGDSFFGGKIAQVAIFNAKVTQATIQGYISQGLSGTETSLISAYSFNNSINDLNTTNANNLTANNSAVATNADSPFGGNSFGDISSTLDYGIVQSSTFSTNTTLVVQVPEGCTIPTSGGVTTVSYSALKTPYGMPAQKGKWRVAAVYVTQLSSSNSANTWTNPTGVKTNFPTGNWVLGYQMAAQFNPSVSAGISLRTTLSTANNTESDKALSCATDLGATSASYGTMVSREHSNGSLLLSSATDYYFNLYATAAGTVYVRGDNTGNVIYADNAYL